jgi:hypothetical protein
MLYESPQTLLGMRPRAEEPAASRGTARGAKAAKPRARSGRTARKPSR